MKGMVSRGESSGGGGGGGGGPDPAAPQRWWIDCDNAAEGVTSFDVGSLTSEDILAVVVGSVWRPLG